MSDCRENCPIINGGFCERHQAIKSITWVKLCTSKEKYFLAWESGKGPGQENVIRRQRDIKRQKFNSNIGNILARRFESIGIKAIQGCPCKNLQNRLNSMSPESILSDVKGWSQRLRLSAKKWKELKGGVWNYIPTPPLWLCQRVLEDAIKEAQGRKDAEELTLIEE